MSEIKKTGDSLVDQVPVYSFFSERIISSVLSSYQQRYAKINISICFFLFYYTEISILRQQKPDNNPMKREHNNNVNMNIYTSITRFLSTKDTKKQPTLYRNGPSMRILRLP